MRRLAEEGTFVEFAGKGTVFPKLLAGHERGPVMVEKKQLSPSMGSAKQALKNGAPPSNGQAGLEAQGRVRLEASR